jgi:hypothetical protein
MKMSVDDFRDIANDSMVYCEKCDDITDSGIEPDATPSNSPNFMCGECGEEACCWGAETAMVVGHIEITD